MYVCVHVCMCVCARAITVCEGWRTIWACDCDLGCNSGILGCKVV